MTVSLVGDGIFLVAMVWQAYELWNAPAALSLLGIGITIPTIAFLLPAGVLSDRLDRRLLMLWADVARAAIVAVLAVLALTGELTFWELLVIVALYGVGTAFFTPAFEAIVPDVVPAVDLPAANSLDQFVRPDRTPSSRSRTGRCAHRDPRHRRRVRGGRGLVRRLHRRRVSDAAPAPPALATRRVIGPRPQGRISVRIQPSVALGTLLSAAVAYLAFMGRVEVLLPYVVKNDLHASAAELGLVFAAGGVGAVGAALVMGQRGHPRRDVTFIYAAWTLATLAVAGYGLATASWQLMIACLIFNALETSGTIVWATVKQRHVPASMLGRVSSLDWLISIGLLPLSFALTAPCRRRHRRSRRTLVASAAVGGTSLWALSSSRECGTSKE